MKAEKAQIASHAPWQVATSLALTKVSVTNLQATGQCPSLLLCCCNKRLTKNNFEETSLFGLEVEVVVE